MQPSVSLCIPAYKQTEQLRRTLQSIIEQKFTDYELLISDDSPDDRVEKLVESFHFGSKLKYWRNKPGKGSPENWNEALRKAKGKYIKILHHDDWFTDQDSLQHFVDLLDLHPEADFAFSAARNWYHAKNQFELYSPGAHKIGYLRHDPMHLLSGNLIGAPSAVIVRKTALELYDPHLIWLVDIEYYIRLIRKNHHFVFTSEPLITNSADSEHRITNECVDNKELEIKEYFYVYNKHQKMLTPKLRHARVLHLLSLVIKYNIHSVQEIRNCGYSGSIPNHIRLYFTLKLFSKTLSARTIYKIIHIQQGKQVA